MGDELINFTPLAQQALALARKESERLRHNFTGTEHLLLGLIRLGQGTAVNVLGKLGLDLSAVRSEVEKLVGMGSDEKGIGNIPYTPRVKRVLAVAAKEAKALNHRYVGTEDILLGLLHEGDGVAARVFKHFEVDAQKTRQEILKELDPNSQLLQDAPTPATSAQEAPPSAHHPYNIDTARHYDAYCREGGHEVIYHNALFKGVRRLLPQHEGDLLADFLELEQADGQTIFVARSCVVKFCEHAAKPKPEDPAKQPPSNSPDAVG